MWSANPLDGIDLSVLEFLASHRNPVVDLVPVTLGVAGTDVVTMAVLQTLALVIALFARGTATQARLGAFAGDEAVIRQDERHA